MADNWTRSVPCRYFKNGICREGNNCQYRHVQETRREGGSSIETEATSTVTAASTAACHFFKQGMCKFGDRCRFKHITDEDSSPATAETSSFESHTSGISSASVTEKIKEVPRLAEEWVNAPEFVPLSIPTASSSSTAETSSTSATTSAPVSYARAVNATGQSVTSSSAPLCPYAEASGICKKPNCTYVHGDICELCGRAALHPHNEEERKKHTNACVKQHEVDMELSFAIQRSQEKSCGVCFEVIMEKSTREQRFGILPNCNHCFCLTCIRKWRQATQFDNKIIRACPECRVTSDFVCPSMYWVDTKEEKEKLIMDYKGVLSTKDCKYFMKGRGKCPFGNKCFYLHALPDGTKADVGPPVRQRRNADSDIDFLHIILWDFLDARDNHLMYSIDELEDIVAFFSDSEDSDWSEYDLFFD
ncbi:probable E3 ubiquitin-protein ligase makorin-1 isoform X2 [Cephus cinctus]|uniref:RING-type E3 ubiquitin transferase n=1 Tax=Cephus cinctus TaxID=211228 RepID=A0AAJ7RL25_CEPCN|nr:probable E3 ubiquitin-protein ligase makorin-1 isoform X2 [Cephus cinctus]